MLDLTSDRGKIVDAALRLAGEHGWRKLSMDRIAVAAGVSLAKLRQEFRSKAHILAGFTRAVDDGVLGKLTPADLETAHRDRLFDVIMTRFELMTPYKSGLRRVREDLQYRPGESLAQFGVAARSNYWMLAAAGVDAEGSRGFLRLPGLMAIYARVFDIWLEDSDPGLARTMAALDSRLRRGERFMQRLDDICATAERFCAGFAPSRGGPKAEAEPPAPVSSEAAPAGSSASSKENGGVEPGSAPAF